MDDTERGEIEKCTVVLDDLRRYFLITNDSEQRVKEGMMFVDSV
jgi:hypothetical protein